MLLLYLGNTPVIVDEPEAHLDSKFIADFLVDLVKTKKCERQIIFATHNANLVINADADLVLHLDAEDCPTVLTAGSIEDIALRDRLLDLEGGEEAFRRREGKYFR